MREWLTRNLVIEFRLPFQGADTRTGHLAPILALVGATGFALLVATPCFAQLGAAGPTSIGAAGERTVRGAEQNNAAKPQITPPPVLPGTKSAPEAAAPTMSPADMTPTDALFDAINRGDLPAARDAVNRGAELNGQNLLGLTPLELSVDLGRNDISFMLLSMREADSASRSLARGGAMQGSDASGSAILRASAIARPVRRSRLTAEAAEAPEEQAAESPRLFSGNGGAPIPAAGFVGFDPGRGTR